MKYAALGRYAYSNVEYTSVHWTVACTASRVLCPHGGYSLKAEGADRVGLSVRMFQHENISPHSDQTWYARYATAANPII
jgi:hypothetical protein